MSGDTKRVLEVNQIDNLQGSTQRVKQETTLNNLRGITQRVYIVGGGGPTPTGTKSITANGVYDVTDFASADVQVPTTLPEIYRIFRVDNGVIVNSVTTPFLPLPSTATDISDYCYINAYANTPASVLSGSIDLSNLTIISGSGACQQMFRNCPGITSIDLSNLTTISGQNACSAMFAKCTGLTSINLSGLTTLNGNYACRSMFEKCPGITSIDLSNLTTINNNYACQNMFLDCTSLATVYIGGTTAIDFGTRTTQFNSMFQGCTQNIDVYAPAASQAKIESFSGYPNFGGTGTVTWHWRS